MTTNSIHNAFINALLADATYVDNLAPNGIPRTGDNLANELKPRLTPDLAKYLSEHFDVVTQYLTDDVTGSGFDATVFRSKDDGQVYVSMRGSEGVADFINDADLSLGGLARPQVVDMVNWWIRSITPAGLPCPQIKLIPDITTLSQKVVAADPVVADGTLFGTSSVVVNGHSLGGHLATSFARLLGGTVPVLHTYTYNSANFNPLSDIAFGQIEAALGIGKTFFPNGAMQTNFYAQHGLNVTTQNLTQGQIGLRMGLFNENSSSQLPNHFMYKVTDALALADAMSKLDSGLSISKANGLFEAGSNVTEASIEGVFNGLNRIINGPDVSKLIGVDEGNSDPNRVKYHEELKKLIESSKYESLKGKVTIQISDSSLATAAREDFAAFVSLLELSPISIKTNGDANRTTVETLLTSSGWSSSAWRDDKDLSKEDKAAGKQTYSDRWMQDRAAMVSAVARYNTKDSVGGTVTAPNTATSVGSTQANYEDKKTGTTLKEGNNNLPKRFIKFGDTADDTMLGEIMDDALYGGKGDDVLKGQGGNDYLEGNEGADKLQGGDGNDTLVGGLQNDELTGGVGADVLKGGGGGDTYKFEAGFGHDTIIDGDGVDKIEVVGLGNGKLDGSNTEKLGEGSWQNKDGKVKYTQVRPAVSGSSTATSDLLITFAADTAYANDTILIEGWSSSKNLGIDLGGVTEPTFSNHLVGEFEKDTEQGVQPGFPLESKHLYKRAMGGGYISTGQTQTNAEDFIVAKLSETTDTFHMEGKGGNDALYGNVNDDLIEGGDGDDFLAGGGGEDSLYGGVGRDYILGSNFYSGPVRVDDAGNTVFVEVGKEHPDIPSDATLITQGFGWNIYTKPIAGSTVPALGLVGLTNPYLYPWLHLVSQDKGKLIDAGQDNDFVISGTGADTTYGGSGDDTLTGLDQGDTLVGGQGGDLIYGDGTSRLRFEYLPDERHGNDVISGEEGDDRLIGQGKDDQIFGGDGEDMLWGDGQGDQIDPTDTPYAIQGNDELDGGDGSDQLIGGGRNDQLTGGLGDDRLWGDFDLNNLKGQFHGNDNLDGEEGDDYLEGGGGSDLLIGGEGHDKLRGDVVEAGMKSDEYGGDTLEGGDGDDTLSGGGKGDTLFGGSGKDFLTGDGDFVAVQDQGDDYLDGGEGDDALLGEGGNDSLFGGDGSDQLTGGDGNDYLNGGAGADLLQGGAGDDTYVMDSQDTVVDDVINNATSVETVDDNEGDNRIILDAAYPFNIQVVHSSAGAGHLAIGLAEDSQVLMLNGVTGTRNTFVLGDETELTTNELIGQYADTSGSGGTGVFSAVGGIANNQEFTMAGRGNDFVVTSMQASTLSGGRGDDMLYGAGANNTYLYAAGDGQDTIKDGSVINGNLSPLGASTIQFGKGITAADISLSASISPTEGAGLLAGLNGVPLQNRYLVVNIGGGTSAVPPGKIAIDGFDFTDPSAPLPVAKLKFANDSEVLLTDLLSSSGVLTTGTDGNDAVQGIWRAETLSGGQGDDTLTGEAGGDTYQWGLGDGKDKVVDAGPSSDIDTLQLLGSLAPADLKFSRVANDLIVRIATANGTTGDELTIKDHFAVEGTDGTRPGIDQVVFSNSAVWSRADIAAHLEALPPLSLTNGNDSYAGTPVDDTVFALAGDDTVSGQDGNDKLDGGDGNDYLAGDEGNDALDGGLGLDYLSGGMGNDTINGGNDSLQDQIDGEQGNDFLNDPNGYDRLIGGAGDDTLVGGSVLEGGEGSDTYRLTAWPSQSQSVELTEAVTAVTENDVLELPAGIQLSDLVFSRAPVLGTEESYRTDNFRVVYPVLDSDDLIIRLNNSPGTGSVRIKGYFSDARDKAGLEQIKLAGGAVLTRSDVVARTSGLPVTTSGDDAIIGFRSNDSLDGGDGIDVIYGYNGDDSLSGGSGRDNLEGGTGNDRLDGGTGHDVLIGGTGNDAFVFGWSSDDDVILFNNEYVTGTDRILMAPGVSPSDVKLIRRGTDLILQLGDSAAQLTVPGYFTTTGPDGQPLAAASTTTGLPYYGGIKSIEFSGGVVWTAQDMASRVVAPVNTVTTAGTVDTVTTRLSTELAAGQENLTATGSLNVELMGNTGNNVITGNDGNNNINNPFPGGTNGFQQWIPSQVWLDWTDSGALVSDTLIRATQYDITNDIQRGDDTLIGGKGDDIYFVNGSEGFNFGEPALPRDVVVELANEGDDTLISSNYSESLSANVENLITWSTLTKSYESSGAAIPHSYIGNDLANRMDVTGVTGLSRVDGGLGADTVYGSSSAKNIYVVDNPGDVVVEVGASDGLGDTVESSINYTLGSDIENLTLTGSAITTGAGNASANVLDGSTNPAANTLVGLAGDDTYILGLNDTVVEALGGGNDTVQLTQLPTDVSVPINVSSWANVENLYLTASLGAANLLGDSVNNKLTGSLAANAIEGADGDDEIFGADPFKVPKDAFSATNALQNIYEIDTLTGGNGNDTIYSVGVQDVISGGNGNDTINLYSKLSGQLIDGGSGNDLIQLVNGNSAVTSQLAIQFGLGAGNDTVSAEGFTGTGGKVQISPTTDASRLRLSRSGSNLVVSLTGASDSMTIQSFFDSATSSPVRSGIDAVMFNEETILNRATLVAALNDADMGLTSNGDDVQVTSVANTSLSGGLGNDGLFGQSTTDRLDGGVGNDLLASGDGNDTLIGGAGDDELIGGRGADTYQFELGWGQDRIVDIPNAQQRQDASVDTVVFALGIKAEDIAVSKINGYDLKLTHKVSGDALVVSQFFWPADASQTGSVELIKFLDGNVTWDLATLTAANKAPTLVQPLQDKTINQGSALNIAIPVDAFVDTDVGDQLTHSATLANGQPLPAWLSFNALNRTFTGTAPASALEIVSIKVTATDSAGETASDVFDINVTNELGMSLMGTAGADTLQGGAGNDRIDGGLGSDMMIGGAGNDTYVVDREGDVVVELPDGGTDTVEVTFNTSARLGNNVENLVVKGNAIVGTGNALNNTITGNPNAAFSNLKGLEGDDTLYGGVGDDVLFGGEGNDLLSGGVGNNTYWFHSANGIVPIGQDTIAGNTVDDSPTKQNTIFLGDVSPSNVILHRVGGDLRLSIARPGYSESDSITVQSFFSGIGPGNSMNPVQRIEFNGGASWNMTDILSRVTGSTPSNAAPTVAHPLADQVASQGAVLNYSVPANTFADADAGDVLTYGATLSNGSALPGWLSFNAGTRTFSGTAPTDAVGATSIKVTATDAAGASVSDIFDWAVAAENKTLTGTNGADVLVGYSGNDSLSGAAGNDSLSGNAGNDLLDGGAGADVIDGGSGNDVVLFGLGDGQDVMQEAVADSAAGKLNILRFKSGVLASQVSVNRVGADLEVSIAGGSDKVTVKSFFAGTGPLAATNPLQRIEFADSTVWDIAHIQTLVNVPVNTAPVVNTPLTDQSVPQGGAINYSVPSNSFTDADAGDVLNYSATLANGAALPSWLSFNANTRTFSGSAPSTLGATSIKVVATDSAGATASDVFDLVVNQAPPAPSGGTVTVRAFSSLADNLGPLMQVLVNGVSLGEQEVRATEYQNYIFSSAQSIPEGAKIEVVFPNDKIDTIGRDRNLFVDSITVNGSTISATAPGVIFDRGVGQEAFDQLDVMAGVNNLWWSGALRFTAPGAPPVAVNTAPIVNSPLADQAVQQGASINYVLPSMAFTDADVGDVLTYTATQSDGSALPSWLSFSASTGTFSGTAPSTLGATSIKVVATDSAGAMASDVFDLEVNQAPPLPSGGTVTVRAFSSLADNLGPLMQVLVNGVSLGEQEVRATEYQNYSFSSAQPIPGGSKIEVVFPNDKIDTIGRDRNLFVDSITVNGSTISATAPGVIFDRGVGQEAFDQLDVMAGVNNLWWSGALRFTAPGAPSIAVNTAPVSTTPLSDQTVQQGSGMTYAIPATAFGDVDASDEFELTVIEGDNTLPTKNMVGMSSNDTLFGDAGNDVLDGGAGNDTYYFGRGQGQDQIRDLEWSANTDVLKFLSSVQAEQLWFRNVGNDLEISIIGTADKVTVRDWYQGEVYWVEQFKTADGRTLNAQNVHAMVTAMAGLTPPPLGQTSLSTSQQAALAPVFAANWILPAASSSTTHLDTFTTESSMKTASLNNTLNGESAKMSMPDSQSQSMTFGGEGGMGGESSPTGAMPVKNPRSQNSTVKNPPLRGIENTLLETTADSVLRTWDLPLGGKGDQAAWSASSVSGKKYLDELSSERLAQLNAEGKDATGADSVLRTWDLPLGGKGDQAAWNTAWVPGKKYFDELSSERLAHLNAGAKVDTSLHALIDAMAAFAPPAAGETSLINNEPDGFKQAIAVDWAA